MAQVHGPRRRQDHAGPGELPRPCVGCPGRGVETSRRTTRDGHRSENLLALSKPTLLEHLEKLQNAGLVKRMDEGRKWIYYELTDKGRKILHPERVAITLALGAAVVLAAIGAFYLLIAGGVSSAGQTPSTNGPAIMEPAHAGPGILGLVLVLLSLGSVVAAFALRFYGLRRRKRFFEQLSFA